jgi:diaminopimelate decarboxylase
MSASHFLEIDEHTAKNIAKTFDSPVFIIDERGVLERFMSFQTLAKKAYSRARVGISYKTNPLQGLLYRFHQMGALAEVVSGTEYKIARRLGVNASDIIFNGPMKTDEELRCAITEGAYINCDHFEEIERIDAISSSLSRKVKLGIRLCFPDIGKGWGRFGFMVNEAQGRDVLHYIIDSPNLSLSGVHAHIGTNIRDISQYELLATQLSEFAWRLNSNHAITLDWIDVGGGLAGISPRRDEAVSGAHPIPDLSAYIDKIVKPLSTYLDHSKAALFFEPGRTVFEPFAALLTEVVGHRPCDKEGLSGLIFNAGNNVMSTAYVYNHPLHCPKLSSHMQMTYLYGPTCNQVDQLHEPALLPDLDRGDHVLLYGVGAYCMSFSYSFIRYRPGVVLWRGGDDASWLRYPENIDYASRLECVPQVTAEVA